VEKIKGELVRIRSLRDSQYGQPFDYPTVQVTVDRRRAGKFNLTMADVGQVARDNDIIEPLRRSELEPD
jgi:hypothetical protein